MKQRKFFKNLFRLLLLNLLIKPVWIFLIDRVVQVELGHRVYGNYFALLNFSYVLFFIADAGISNMLNQKLASGTGINLKQLVFFKITTLLLYVLVCLVAGWLTQLALWPVLLLIVVTQVLNSLFVFLRSIITANQYFGVDTFFSVLDKGLLILLCAGPLYLPKVFGPISLQLFLYLQVLATSIAVAAAVLFLLQKKVVVQGPTESAIKLLHDILPFALIILLMSAHYRLDGFLLERLHPDGAFEAGVYAAAYRLLDAANMIGYLVAGFLVPFIARHQSEGKLLQDTIITTRHGLLLSSILIAAFVWAYTPWLQQVLYHNNSSEQTQVMRLCLAALPAYFLTHVYGSLLTATARFSFFTRILVFAVLINVVINCWLIPQQGAEGAAKAALASQYFCAIACMLASKSKVPLHLFSCAGYVVFAIVVSGIFYLVQALQLPVWLCVLFAFTLSLIFVFVQRHKLKQYFTPFQ